MTVEGTEDLVAALECLMLVSGGPVPIDRLAQAIQRSPAETETLIDALRARYDGRGLMVQPVAGGWQLCTRPEFAPYVTKLLEIQAEPLTKATLETLAIISYKQPVTRPEVEAVRGVGCGHHIRKLLGRNLIGEVGRKPTPGQPVLYGTTELFLRHFGLRDLNDLPPVLGQQRLTEAVATASGPPAAD
ncbi:MAG: SMC-Scp complex subunit ScpB [Armatimonadetes bacterium]|nr:SMC-Scp complex subunit ScpB [Armatimonadota bacterium]